MYKIAVIGDYDSIYGFAALILPVLLRPFSHNWLLLFVVGMVIATTLGDTTEEICCRLMDSPPVLLVKYMAGSFLIVSTLISSSGREGAL